MAITFAQLLTILQHDTADSSNSTFATQCLNHAQRVVARARPWPELRVRAFFNTYAAYDTGTVAVTENSTGVTLTTGTWPATVASQKWRFALSISDPWYEVTTRTSDAVIALAQAYVQDTDTSTDYIVYKSHYSLASDVDRVEEMWLHEEGEAVPLLNAATDETVTDYLHYPSGPGTPTHYLNMERDGSGYRQVLLGPETPDDVYRVEYTYFKKTTDDTYGLDESRWPVVMALAKSLAYEAEFYERSVAEMRKYEVLLAKAWAEESETSVTHVRVGQGRVQYPGTAELENILGRGTVADPS